ncbi:MAG: hypothetical protein II640_07545 [Lachnospiraceae bacterium]|nr:hypothetical protein [Lachnospiraceae bacterium]
MKKRNMIVCTMLSISLAANLILPAMAEDTAQTQTQSEMPGGQTPGQGGPGGNGGTPPEKPSGEAPSGAPSGAPDGQGGPGEGGTPPEMPSGEAPSGEMPGGPGEMGGPGGQESVEYTAVNEVSSGSEEYTSDLESTGTDENVILVSGADASATVKDAAVTRTSEDSDSNNTSSFYGNAAALLATDGTLYVSDSTISTNSGGGAGAFAYGDGTVYIADTAITTQQGTSGGIHAAGGGTLYAWNLDVNTAGGSSAAIRSDRGGGTMVIDGGTYTTTGIGSPAIYSTADIAVHDADLTAENSEATCIEGLNSIRLFDCDLSGNMPADNEQNDVLWNVIVYQSMSGDAQDGNGTFEMVGGTLTAQAGGMFYTTNTQSTFILNDVDITYAEDSDFFLRCTGNANGRGWGTSGANGAQCSFTGITQEMEGDVIWDKISTLNFYMTQSSTLTGAVTEDTTYSSGEGDGYCNLYIDETSTWTVTGDSTLTSLSCSGTIQDEEGNTVSIVGTDGTTYVEGTSPYTITVDTYTDSADMSGASSADSWDAYAAEQPQELA